MKNYPPYLHSARRYGFALVLGILLCGITSFAQSSPSGSLTGRVFNLASGIYLSNARVTVEETGQTTFTNQNGDYRFSDLPAGVLRITVAHTGVGSHTQSVQVFPRQTARLDFELSLESRSGPGSSVVSLDAFTVEERELSAQGHALHTQRTAANIKNVVAMDEFGDLGITNPGHFLTYVPGVTNVYNTTGEVEGIGVRGMPSSGTVVMFDGMQAATNDPNSRSFNFSGSSTANIDYIEVTKVPTPDLPGNAVGGSINMVTKSGFSRRNAILHYNVFATLQAKGSSGNLNGGWSKRAGTDSKTTLRPAQPGFDLSYTLPVNDVFALTFNASHSTRLQDWEYITPTWDRVRLVQTNGTFNALINVFTKDNVALGSDWKIGNSVLKARVDVTQQDAFTRQHQFVYNFGAGATGDQYSSQGTAAGVGVVRQTLGTNLNQYRRLLNLRLSQHYTGDLWAFDWTAAYSENRRLFSDIDEGLFYTVNASIPNIVLRGQGFDGIYSMRPPTFTAQSRTGATVDPYNTNDYLLDNATSGRMYFKNRLSMAGANVERRFATRLPLRLKAGVLYQKNHRDNWTESLTWTINPPATAGGRVVGNHDLISEAYSARQSFPGSPRLNWLSPFKLHALYVQNPSWFQLNEVTAYTNRVNSTRDLQEEISAAYLRADLKAFDQRLSIATGVRLEHTANKAYGPLNDILATYQRDAAGNVLYGSNGRPLVVPGDALTLAKLQYKTLGAFSKSSYRDFFPSINANYAFRDSLIMRVGYAGTIGRPDLSFLVPGTTISDPSVALPTITVVNTALQPWTADNYDLTLESYDVKGATLSVSGFHKRLQNFFVTTRVPATQELVDQYGLPYEVLDANYEISTRTNSADHATLTGLELSWRQSFRPFTSLPPWARSFNLFANSTHLKIGGPGADNFSGYSTRVINGGVSYLAKQFAIKVNFTHSNGPRNAVVAANATTPAGTYSGLADRTLVGGSIEYRINKFITLHLSGQNLSNALYRNMTYSPGAPSYTHPFQFRDNGVEYVVGLKGSF